MAKKNTTRYALLGMLSGKPKSAYSIQKDMQSSINYFWSESDGQLYPTLKQLAQEKLLTYEEETTPGGRSKKIYTITKAGLAELKAWLKADEAAHPVRLELLLKLFFSHQVNKSVALKRLQKAKENAEAKVGIFQAIEQEISNDPTDKEERYAWLTLRYGMRSAEMLIAWCEESINEIKRWK